MHRYSPARRPLSAIITSVAVAFSGLAFVFVATPASAVPVGSITVQVDPAAIELGESFTGMAEVHAGRDSVIRPTGQVTLRFFAPSDPTCSAAVYTAVGPLSATPGSANRSRTAAVPFTPNQTGTYRVIAEYSGDTTFDPASSACGADGSTVEVTDTDPSTKQDITLTTQVSDDSITLGESVTDTITLTPPTGGPKPTGNVGFAVYGPDDATCETAIPMGVVAIDPNSDSVTSSPFTPTEPGTYRWIGSYHGDDNYNTHLADCNEPNETVVVTDPDGGGDPGIVDPDPDPDGDGGREADGDEDEDGDGDGDGGREADGDEDEDEDGDGGREGDGDGDESDEDGDESDEDEGDEGGDLPDTGAQGSPLLLGLGLVLTTAGYIISWRHRPDRSR